MGNNFYSMHPNYQTEEKTMDEDDHKVILHFTNWRELPRLEPMEIVSTENEGVESLEVLKDAGEIVPCKKCGDGIPDTKVVKKCKYCLSWENWIKVGKQRMLQYRPKCKNPEEWDKKWNKKWEDNWIHVSREQYKLVRQRGMCQQCGVVSLRTFVGRLDPNKTFDDNNTIACCYKCLNEHFKIWV